MKKITSVLLLLTLSLLFVAAIPTAAAAGFLEELGKNTVVKFFATDFAATLSTIDATTTGFTDEQTTALIVAKIIFFIMLLSILYGIGTKYKPLKERFGEKQLTIVLVAIAAISTIAMPTFWLVVLVKAAGPFLAFIALLGLSGFLIYQLVSYEGEDRPTVVIRLGITLLLVILINYVRVLWSGSVYQLIAISITTGAFTMTLTPRGLLAAPVPATLPTGAAFALGVIGFILGAAQFFFACYLIYLLYLLVVGPEEHAHGEHEEAHETPKHKTWAGKQALAKLERTQIKAINEHITEAKELNTIKKVSAELDALKRLVIELRIKPEVYESDYEQLKDFIERVIKDARDARSYYRTVKSRTARQHVETRHLIHELHELGLDTKTLDAESKKILTEHDEAIKALELALSGAGANLISVEATITSLVKKIKKHKEEHKTTCADNKTDYNTAPVAPVTVQVDIDAALNTISDAAAGLGHDNITAKGITKAEERQEEALRMLEGIIAQTKHLAHSGGGH